MAVRVPTNLTLPPDLLAEVDTVAGPRGRSRFVEEAVRRALKRERLRMAASRAAGAWRDHPLFPSSEAVVEWVRKGRAEKTDPGTA
jgi:predicted transcriptional regulator